MPRARTHPEHKRRVESKREELEGFELEDEGDELWHVGSHRRCVGAREEHGRCVGDARQMRGRALHLVFIGSVHQQKSEPEGSD